MIITQTPLRVSFLGGGTDYPEYFSRHGGATLGTAINKYVYITVTRLTEFFDHRIRASYSRHELCKSIDELQHPSVRECLRFMGISGGLEISIVSDLPARTGLGSSSSFTVGLLNALHAFKGEVVGRETLAAEAVHVERNLIVERVGLQDQYTCACGGLVKLEFQGENVVTVNPVPVPGARLAALEQRMMIFYTGQQRTAHEILETQIARTSSGAIDQSLQRMHGLVDRGVQVLSSDRDLGEFGELLDEAWVLKRQFSSAVSNPLVDDAYSRARTAGAVGGKLLGAGGGGFLLLYVEPARQEAVLRTLEGMRRVDFGFESRGSRLIFFQHH
jgi:D-glycero-alpha-D-manno-heptose-7-phosphate kinase